MKVLVTGAGGQVGRALLASAPPGWQVDGADRAECDLADPVAIRALVARHRPQVLINAAAYTAVDKAQGEPDLARAINADAVAAMRDASDACGARMVQISTDFVFDGKASRAWLPQDARHPLSVYGLTKAQGEDAAGADALIVRTSWVHAAGGSNFVTTMLRLMRERAEIGVVADQIGAPTWATGLAQTIWTLVQRGARGVFHHQDAGVASWYDFAVAIAEEAGSRGMIPAQPAIRPIATSDYPTPAVRPQFALLDCSTTRDITGEAPAHWRENLRRMLDEQRALA